MARRRVSRSPTPLLTALKLAVAGNVIDFGAYESFDLEKTIEDVLKRDFSIFDYKELKDSLSRAERVLYLVDNAGEIVFDRVLIEYLLDRYSLRGVDVVVKSRPVLNDAMLEDAIQTGLDRIDGVGIIEIEPYGREGLSRESPDFHRLMQSYDVIISKGQANYEYLNNMEGIFFLFMVKCDIVSRELSERMGQDVRNGDIVLWRSHGT